ncbi:MAG: TIGR00725 family protein [Candidatus Omnitrophica bacterium]|nr:TIGR00725 family protein [Candidatus Omnitrophota bacterium]
MTIENLKYVLRIAVIGGSNPKNDILTLAEEAGRLIAKNRCLLVTGGLGGVMEAASKGAKKEGGITLGILPQNNTDSANEYVDFPVATGLGWIRNALVVMNSDAVVAIDGEYGTLTEISNALLYNKPVFGVKTWGVSKGNDSPQGLTVCLSVEEAVQSAIKAAKNG